MTESAFRRETGRRFERRIRGAYDGPEHRHRGLLGTEQDRKIVGYVFRLDDARLYDQWFQSESGQSVARIEKDLLLRVWSPKSAQRVLEVGCGTGLFLEWLAQLGHQVSGIEPSLPMLDLARKRLPEKVDLYRGFAEDLPYEDNAFDTVALITTLEFVDDPSIALREAFRVARRQVLIGSLNKYSIIAVQRFVERLLRPSVYRWARFFGVSELRDMTEKILCGSVPLMWRTTLSFPLFTLRYLSFIERSPYFQWHPFGHFIAMRVDLRYPMQTIQDPLLHEIPASMGGARLPTSCWRTLHEEESPSRGSFRPPAPSLEDTSQGALRL